MESDLQQHHHLFHAYQPPMMNPGLTRFRSAPSSFFASVLDSCEEFLNRPSSPETERMLTRLISGGNIGEGFQSSPATNEVTTTITNNNSSSNNQQSQFMGNIKSEAEVLHNNSHSTNYGSASSQSFYQNSSQPPFPNRNMRGNNTSSLIRQSSSPAGLFSNIHIDNGFTAAVGGMNGNNGGDAMFPPTTRFNSQTNFSAGFASSMAQMSPIAEIVDKSMGSEGQDNSFAAGFPVSSWDDDTSVTENFGSLKRGRDGDQKTFSGLNASEAQNEEARSCATPVLAHHLSLPKSSAEMSAIEKFLQLQDSVPCKIRAKRGCATHPRSIAERVRRTRISERMRKLQDLVPNMDKQTNTADMLDLAVEYIKELQTQVKILSTNRARCTCLSRHQL